MKITVQIRIIIIISIILTFFTAAITYMKISFNAHINQIVQGEATHQSQVLSRILELQAANLNSYVFDYTYWDEMVTIVEQQNLELASLNIDPSMDSYNVQAVWVLDSLFDLVYFTCIDRADGALKDINKCVDIRQVIADTIFKHFYCAYDNRLAEFSIAPIQPSIDIARNTPARGFYVAARLWDNHYVDQLSRMTDSKIKINTAKSQALSFKFDKQSGSIFINIPLRSWDGNTAAYLESTDQKDFVRYFVKSANSLFIAAVIGILFIFVVVTLFIVNWLGKPLTQISRSLKEQNTDHINKLLHENNEFGSIAALLADSFQQKAALEDEILMRIDAEAALRESESKLRSIIETSPVVFWSMDTNFDKFYFISHAVETLTGYRFSEIEPTLGSWIKLLLKPESLAQIQDHKAAIQRSRVSRSFECEIVHKNGTPRICSIITTPALDQDGEIYRIDGLVIDITDKTELTKKFLQSEKMAAIGLLAAGVAHEFNNMLCAIRGNIELLSGHCALCDDCRDNTKDAVSACDRAGSLVESLLSYSRSSILETGNVDINHIIKSMLRLIEKEINQAGVRMHLSLAEVPIIRGVPGQIQQAVFNIIRNAIQATPHGGLVSIRTIIDGTNIIVQISDTGIGIDPLHLDKIFDPFFSTKGTWGNSNLPGTGMGLSTSRNFIRNHDGEISVTSGLGKGSIFTIRLPIKLRIESLADSNGNLSGKSILLYEFNQPEASRLIEIINKSGGIVEIAIWADDVAELMARNHYDCIIIDLGNPAMGDLVRVFELLAAKYGDFPIIIVADKTIKYQFMEYTKAARAILNKPYTETDLVKSIQNISNSPNRVIVESVNHTANA